MYLKRRRRRCDIQQSKPHVSFQTYVLRVEVIVCGLALVMQAVHLVFSFICMISFYSGT